MSYPQRPYLVEYLFPTSSFNIIGGASGAGKTRLLFECVMDMLMGNSIFGLKCLQEIRPIYFCLDRLLCAVHDIMNDMKIEFGPEFPIKSIRRKSLPTKAEIGDRNFIIIDGVDFLVDSGKIIDLRAVSDLCFRIQDLAEETKACFACILGSPKGRGKDNNYELTRELIIGSGAWGRTADNVILIEGVPDDPTRNLRTIRLAFRIGKGELAIPYQFTSDGWLRSVPEVEIEEPIKVLTPLTKGAAYLLKSWPSNSTFTATQLEDFIQTLNPPISAATLYRALDQFQDHNLITKSAENEYSLMRLSKNE